MSSLARTYPRLGPPAAPAVQRAPARAGTIVVRGGFLVAALGLLAYAAHCALGLGGPESRRFFEDGVYNGVLLGAGALALGGALRCRGERAARLVLGLGLLAWASGTLLDTLSEPGAPAIADALWLAFYPASYACIFLLVRSRVREFHPVLWLDGIVGGLVIAAAGAAIVLPPVAAATSGETGAVIIALLYPLGDLVLLGLVTGVFALTAWRPGRSWALLLAGFAVGAVADATFVFQNATGAYVEGGLLDPLWLVSALLLAGAAWQPAGGGEALRLEGWRILTVPSLFALAAIALLVANALAPLGALSIALAALALVAVIARIRITFRESLRMLEHSRTEALTDSLTGLGNRRQLVVDLERALEQASEARPARLGLYDLDGFKRYNDAFGHPAGDALLARLGRDLGAAVGPDGTAYRLGGDEFCVLVTAAAGDPETVIAAGSAALVEHGKGFAIESSCGSVVLPAEAADAQEALRIADERLYTDKGGRRQVIAMRQTRDVLLQVLREREPDLGEHLRGVADLAVAVGRELGLAHEELDEVARAAELHDVGKMAVPDAMLQKPRPLDASERRFMRRHTVIGERMLNVAPALRPVARLVRASHERFDGQGYPDGLAGEDIPLGARIVCVCDAFDAMTSDRPYHAAVPAAEAIAELRGCAGSQFDPRVVEAFCAVIEAGHGAGLERAGAEAL